MRVACGDMRDLVKTILDLPKAFGGRLIITMIDHDELVVGRMVLIMTILLLEDIDASSAVDCALHVWYSAFLTDKHLSLLCTKVKPLLKSWIANPGAHAPFVQTGLCGNRLLLAVTPKLLERLVVRLDARLDYGKAIASRLSIVMARPDMLDATMFDYRTRLHRRCSILHFKGTGVLLPYGTDVTGFKNPNP